MGEWIEGHWTLGKGENWPTRHKKGWMTKEGRRQKEEMARGIGQRGGKMDKRARG
jgi:hypothetical protein